MKIISVRDRTVDLASASSNAAISFEAMTASAVAVEIETRKGRFRGLGFSSIGRFSHGGLLRERFIPRLLNASADDLHDPETQDFFMARLWAVLMKNEKEGGHGERSGAVGVLESALWDAWAKSEDLPLWALVRREFGGNSDAQQDTGRIPVYASGGHYSEQADDSASIRNEVRQAFDQGFGWFKLKIGGASQQRDMERIDAAVTAADDPSLIAVDANCAFDGDISNALLQSIDRIGLRWIEEPVNPLNYRGLHNAASTLSTSIATGENIFSNADTQNLLHYGGLRPGKDILQMDILLSYGLTEFVRMLKSAEALGWSRRNFIPHAGHQTALHVCAGLGLGAHEAASASGPFGGVSDDTVIADGQASLSDRPGAGIEYKPSLFKYFDGLID